MVIEDYEIIKNQDKTLADQDDILKELRKVNKSWNNDNARTTTAHRTIE